MSYNNESLQPGGIRVEQIKLTSNDSKKTIDLREICIEFSIFESVKQPFMSADLMINDSLALTTQIPIVGNETIEIDFRVPIPGMEDQPFSKKFRVFAINKIDVHKNNRNSTYILRCYDPEYFYELTNKVRKSYVSVTVNDMVSDVFVNYLKGDVSKLTTSTSLGTPTIVVPNMKPVESILKLFCNYAKSSLYPEVCNYVFYSSKDGYYFKTIEEMIDSKNYNSIIDTYVLTEKNTPTNEANITSNIGETSVQKPKEWLKIIDFEIVNKINIEESIIKGMYDNSVYYHNPSMGSFQKKTYNYKYNFDKFKRTSSSLSSSGSYKTITEESDLAKLGGDSKLYYIPSNNGEFNSNSDIEDPRYNYMMYQKASFTMLDNITINLTVPGDNTRKIGDIINILLPEFGASDDIIGEIDKYISGYYSVMAVRHIRNIDSGYMTILQCVKNCFEQNLENIVKT